MLYILVAVLIFGILIATHELGHFGAAKLVGVQVNEFSVGMGPAIIKKTVGNTLYSLRILPIGGYCAMEGEDEESENPHSLSKAAMWKKIVILVAGAAVNFLTGLLLCMVLVMPIQVLVQPVVAGFAEGFPLEGDNGLMVGDRILEIDGERIYRYDNVTLFFSRSNGETMDLVVERDGDRVELNNFPLRLREYTVDGQVVLRYGVNFQVSKVSFFEKLHEGWFMTWDFVRLVRLSIADLINGAAGFDDLSGPVGIVDVMTDVGASSDSASAAAFNMAYLSALIAVNLAVMNLLPLPALDGGRILFLFVDALAYALFRKKIDPKYEAYIHLAGMAALMTLMIMVTVSDVGKLFGK